ncbi:Uncharacterised protein [Legionella waltersii]|nr:Uncharacterised protein [Legionella waltersii]
MCLPMVATRIELDWGQCLIEHEQPSRDHKGADSQPRVVLATQITGVILLVSGC